MSVFENVAEARTSYLNKQVSAARPRWLRTCTDSLIFLKGIHCPFEFLRPSSTLLSKSSTSCLMSRLTSLNVLARLLLFRIYGPTMTTDWKLVERETGFSFHLLLSSSAPEPSLFIHKSKCLLSFALFAAGQSHPLKNQRLIDMKPKDS